MGMLVLMGGVVSCSDDDGDGGNGGSGDTTAPVVSEIEPDDQTGVSVNEPVVVEFSEAMDQTTADGNITLSSGDITGFTWTNNGQTVSVAHSAWAEATQVTVNVLTGLKDLAGNSLAQQWTASFWTESSNVVFLESDPAHNASDVSRSVQPRLRFSHTMDLTSLRNATTITQPGKSGAVVPTWTMSYVGDNWYRITFDDNLDETATYNIAVATTAHAEGNPGMQLSAAVAVSFTTGADVDNEPPRISGVNPAEGSVVNPDLTTIVVTFSEPIDTQEDVTPNRVGAAIMAVMAGEPIWNVDNSVLTIYLQPPLPAGVRIFADFEPGSFRDLAGNANTETFSISFTVSGTPDFYPVFANWEYNYLQLNLGPPKQFLDGEVLVTFENISGETFDMVEWRWDYYFGEWEEDNREYMRDNSGGLWIRGFREEVDEGVFEDIMFTPEVLYQKMPWAEGTWDGSASFPIEIEGTPTTGTVTYDGITVGQETLVFDSLAPGEPAIVFEDCWKSILNYQLSAMEQTFQTSHDTLWYAPGIGIVQEFNWSYDVFEDRTDWERRYLMYVDIE
jgi:hypothetical protein